MIIENHCFWFNYTFIVKIVFNYGENIFEILNIKLT